MKKAFKVALGFAVGYVVASAVLGLDSSSSYRISLLTIEKGAE